MLMLVTHAVNMLVRNSLFKLCINAVNPRGIYEYGADYMREIYGCSNRDIIIL